MRKIILIIVCALSCTSCMNTLEVYTITAESSDTTMGTVSGGGNYLYGSNVTLTAFPKVGYKFDRWKIHGDGTYGSGSSSSNPYQTTVYSDKSYVAFFKCNTNVRVSDYGTYSYNFFDCHINVLSKEFDFVTAPTSTGYPIIKIRFEWPDEVTTGTFFGHSLINLAIIGANSWGNNTEIDFDESQILPGNPSLWYYSGDGMALNLGNETFGNWWDKEMTLNITNINLDDMLISFVVNTTIGNLKSCIDNVSDWSEAITRQLTITATDVPIIIQ